MAAAAVAAPAAAAARVAGRSPSLPPRGSPSSLLSAPPAALARPGAALFFPLCFSSDRTRRCAQTSATMGKGVSVRRARGGARGAGGRKREGGGGGSQEGDRSQPAGGGGGGSGAAWTGQAGRPGFKDDALWK